MNKMILPPLSDEQLVVYNHIVNGENVIVNACAGSGKSTTILSIAEKNPTQRILQITYNSMLRKDVQETVSLLGLSNITVHTFHSLCVSTYDSRSYTDTGIRQVLRENTVRKNGLIPGYDLIVLDEAQDMSALYFQLILKFIRDYGSRFQLLVLGDFRQGLYEFKGADIRFLTMAHEIWSNVPLLRSNEFVFCTFIISYRLTHPMASFVNQVMIGDNRMRACRDGESVTYIRNGRQNLERSVVAEVQKLLDGGSLPSDIFILAASMKASSHIRKIENALVERGIPCHVPMRDDSDMGLDERVINGKVVFSTFHTVKGRQRAHVFVFGFDNSYMTYYGRDLTPTECPNTLYVAATRAKDRLYFLERDQYKEDRPLPFLRMSHVEMKRQPFIQFKGIPQNIVYKTAPTTTDESSYHFVQPSELLRFVSEVTIELLTPEIMDLFVAMSTYEEEMTLEIPTTTTTRMGYTEEVSDLNGIVIPSIYYERLLHPWVDMSDIHHNVLYQAIMESLGKFKGNDCSFLRRVIEQEMPTSCQTIPEYLYLANLYTATKEELYFKLQQIPRDEYTWLNPSVVEECHRRLDAVIGGDASAIQPQPEVTLIQREMEEEQIQLNAQLSDYFQPDGRGNKPRFAFAARIDLLTDTTIWEWKCTSRLTIEHFVQVVLYAWIWSVLEPHSPKQVKLFNIKTGELYEIRQDLPPTALLEVVVKLLKAKFCTPSAATDHDFISTCQRTVNRIFNLI